MSDTVLPYVDGRLVIGGARRESASGRRLDVHDPATGRTLASVADASAADATAALDAAVDAQADWARTAPRARADILRTAYELILQRADSFAALITAEMGKPLAESRGEVTYGAEFLRWFAEEAVRTRGSLTTSPDGRSRLHVHHRAVGPCLLITPWNFPLAMATRKIGPAVAAGCSMVLKPAELTPLTTLLLVDVLTEAGLPPGVLNVVTTSTPAETLAPLLADARLRKLSFTGSTAVGSALLTAAAPNVLRTSMELGGNAPFLVFADADLDHAVDGLMLAKFRNTGQACTAANRILVHDDVAEELGDRLAARVEALVVGPGDDPASDIGPLINHRAVDRVASLVADARAGGATARASAAVPRGAGCWSPPTVLIDVAHDAQVLQQEIFGPVAPIVRFASDAEAVALANATPYGLAAYAFTQDLGRAQRLMDDLETGMLAINAGIVSNPAAPFGGVKQSGLGREGGQTGLDEYLETVYTAVPLT